MKHALFKELHDSLSTQLHDDVLDQFKVATIQATVKEAGQTIINNELRPAMDRDEALVDADIAVVDMNLAMFNSDIEFERLLFAAQADDLAAWDRLKQIAEDKTSPHGTIAGHFYTKVADDHYDTGVFTEWGPDWDSEALGPLPSQWDPATLRAALQNTPP